uniref:Uncharacterized protein n=1 Tax=Anguilla anguilla TaxID=7936 RepID=A0A0E9WM84_ANGAN
MAVEPQVWELCCNCSVFMCFQWFAVWSAHRNVLHRLSLLWRQSKWHLEHYCVFMHDREGAYNMSHIRLNLQDLKPERSCLLGTVLEISASSLCRIIKK